MVVMVMAVVAMMLISWRLPSGAPMTLKQTTTVQGYKSERRPVPLPVPVLLATVESAFVAQVPPLMRTDKRLDASHEKAPVMDSRQAMAGEMHMPGLGRIVLVMTLLVLFLVVAIRDLYHLRDRLLHLIEWGEGQEWHTVLKRVVTMDAARFTAWRKRQDLWLRAKYNAVKAELLGRYQQLDRYALMTGWNAFKAHLFNWLKWLG